MKSTILKITPKYFSCDEKGKKKGIFLTKKQFERLMEEREELYDYELVRKREKKKEKIYSFEEIRAETLARIKK